MSAPGGFGPPPGGGGGFGPPPGGPPPGGGGFGPPPGGGGPVGGGPPGGGGFGPPGGGPPSEGPLRQIPFTPEQDASIGGAGRFMMAAGALTLIVAFVNLVKAAVQVWVGVDLPEGVPGGTIYGGACAAVLGAVLAAVFGVWLIIGGRAARAVVDTDDADQENLLVAVVKLRQVFMLKAVLIIAGVLLMCILAVFVGGATAAMMQQ